MKRVKESGAFFKKKKSKEAELKKHEGAMLKFLNSSGSSVSPTIPDNDSNENPDNNVPFRGHRKAFESNNQGNFLERVKVLAKCSPVLSKHFSDIRISKKMTTTYLSFII